MTAVFVEPRTKTVFFDSILDSAMLPRERQSSKQPEDLEVTYNTDLDTTKSHQRSIQKMMFGSGANTGSSVNAPSIVAGYTNQQGTNFTEEVKTVVLAKSNESYE